MDTNTPNLIKSIAAPVAMFLVSFVVAVLIGISVPLESSARIVLAGIYVSLSVIIYLWLRSNINAAKQENK